MGRAALLARVDSAIAEVNFAADALSRLDVGQRLAERVRGRLDRELKGRREAFLQIDRDVRASQSDDDLALLWGDFARETEVARPVHREALAFLEGILLRVRGLDGGLCDAADALLDEIGRRAGVRWDRFTLLDEGDLFADVAGLVRIRFPPFGMWDLPVAVHEFGHAVGPEIRVGNERPFENLLEPGRLPIDAPDYASYVHEYFADCFATWTVGPAYAAACLLLRFDPARASADGKRHPSANRRAHVILTTLAALDEHPIMPTFAGLANLLRDLWERSVAGAGDGEPLDDPDRQDLDAVADALRLVLEKGLEPAARYSSAAHNRAGGLAPLLAAADDGVRPDEEPAITDVVNAAWIERLARWEQPDSLAVGNARRNALRLCKDIADERAARAHGET